MTATKTKQHENKAKFAGHHQIPILFASNVHNHHDFYFIVSPYCLNHKYYYFKQTKKEKKSYYCHNYTNKLSPYVPSPFVAFSRLTTFCKLRPLLLRCFMTKTCELCIGGTIVLHRPSVLQNKTRQIIAT